MKKYLMAFYKNVLNPRGVLVDAQPRGWNLKIRAAVRPRIRGTFFQNMKKLLIIQKKIDFKTRPHKNFPASDKMKTDHRNLSRTQVEEKIKSKEFRLAEAPKIYTGKCYPKFKFVIVKENDETLKERCRWNILNGLYVLKKTFVFIKLDIRGKAQDL